MFPKIQHGMQRGFAIVSAIFLLVVLAALGGFIATIATTQHVGSAQDFQGTQVYYAARAGSEWGLYQAGLNPLINPVPSCVAGTVAASNFVYPVGNISVTVNCATTVPDEAGAGNLYTITTTACTPGNAVAPFCPGDAANANYIERRVTALADSTTP